VAEGRPGTVRGGMVEDALADRRLDEEDHTRARVYGLLARYLAAPPDADLLQLTRGLGESGTPFGRALAELAARAAEASVESAREEYHELFIGLGRGELLPYASYYLTGFLYERPLAELRDDLRTLGIARVEQNKEPEDHIATLCEIMAGLIEGRYGDGTLDLQRRFFARHLEPWAGRFFTDLERAKAARLYAPLGSVGRLFVDIERAAFAMAD